MFSDNVNLICSHNRVLDFYLSEGFSRGRILLMGLPIRLSVGFPIKAVPPFGLYFCGVYAGFWGAHPCQLPAPLVSNSPAT